MALVRCKANTVLLSPRMCGRLCFLHRMRCADILADTDTDGQWIIAKAVFNDTVTGEITLVRQQEQQQQSFSDKHFIIPFLRPGKHHFIIIND